MQPKAPIAIADTYRDAYAATLRDRRPLLVLAGATWCGPCQQVNVAALGQRGHYAKIDIDREPQLALRVVPGRSVVPRLAVYVWDGRSYRVRVYCGLTEINAYLATP